MDLTNQDSWHLVAEIPNYLNQQGLGYLPLKPLSFVVSSPVFSVKVTTPITTIKTQRGARDVTHWIRGCWASLWGNLTGQEEKLFPSQTCRLNAKNLVQFPDLGIVPYRLQLDFPRWIPIVGCSVWEYIDQSGKYLSNPVEEALSELNAKIVGENIVFSSVNYQELIDGTTTFQQSIFTAPTPYNRYEIGRFKRTDTGLILSDPIVTALPNQITAVFTGLERIPPGVVTVTVVERN